MFSTEEFEQGSKLAFRPCVAVTNHCALRAFVHEISDSFTSA